MSPGQSEIQMLEALLALETKIANLRAVLTRADGYTASTSGKQSLGMPEKIRATIEYYISAFIADELAYLDYMKEMIEKDAAARGQTAERLAFITGLRDTLDK